MKNILLTILFFYGLLTSAMVSAEGELSLANKALTGDYQAQRNLAYSYANGWGKSGENDYIPQDAVRACAWRKVILLSNSQKANSTDYSSESIDCKNVLPTENQQVWNLVWTIVNSLQK
ncbi:hypothetical protein ACS6VG_000941 [Raoultella planticola]